MLRHAEFGADGEIDLATGAFRQIVAGDLAPAVRGCLDKRLAPAKDQIRKPRLLKDLASGGGEEILARFDLALGEVPIAKSAEQQIARAILEPTPDHDARGMPGYLHPLDGRGASLPPGGITVPAAGSASAAGAPRPGWDPRGHRSGSRERGSRADADRSGRNRA